MYPQVLIQENQENQNAQDTNEISHSAWREHSQSIALACLYLLVFFNLVQVFAAFAGFNPHPPEAVVPLIVATAGLGIAAIPLILRSTTLGSYLSIAFAVVSMIGMGPHKLFLENGLVIAPVALLGFIAAVVLIISAVKMLRQNERQTA